MPGANEEARCHALGDKVMAYYDDNGILDRLKNFLPKSYKGIKQSARPPKLKGSAATCRALVPFCYLIALEYLSDAEPVEAAMKQAAYDLKNCYDSLSDANKDFSHEALYESLKNFALQYQTLYEVIGRNVLWRPMPKMHMFLELCSMRTEPQKFWNYRDEDFRDSVAKQSRMRRRWEQLKAYAKNA